MSTTTDRVTIRDLAVEMTAIADLTPCARNARTHTRDQIRRLADAIREFGWTNPVLVDRKGDVLAGHGRIEAARLLGMTHVPVIRITDMSEAQKRACRIADNRLAELAGWDDGLLVMELDSIVELDAGFDLELTGFETAEIDRLHLEAEPDAGDGDDVPDPDPGARPVAEPGDVWILGDHRLMCGDATDADAYKRVMAGETAAMVFTDPPYNVPIDGHVSGKGAVKHREFAMASGEMDAGAFTAFLESVLGHMAGHAADGALIYVCMDWRHLFELLGAGRTLRLSLRNLCVWVKTNGGMGSLYRSRHELVAVFKAGSAPHVNNVQLGRHGRNRTNVWEYAGQNSFGAERDEALAMHPTVKPVALVADALRDATRRGAGVLDPFAGSGTIFIAAERTDRRAFGIEIDPAYVDVALRRWRALTGREPVHEASGLTLAQLE